MTQTTIETRTSESRKWRPLPCLFGLRWCAMCVFAFLFSAQNAIIAYADPAAADALVDKALDTSRSLIDRQGAFQAILGLAEEERQTCLHRVVISGDAMFRSSAGSYLLRNGDEDDAKKVASVVSGWKSDEQCVLLQTIPIIGELRQPDKDLARAILRAASGKKAQEQGASGPSSLGASAFILAMGGPEEADIKLIEAAASSQPRHFGLWLSLALIGEGTALRQQAISIVGDESEDLELRIGAGLTLPEDSPDYRWAIGALRDFTDEYKDIEILGVSQGDATRIQVMTFLSRVRVLGLLQIMAKRSEDVYVLSLLKSRNSIVRCAAGMAIALHMPAQLVSISDHRLTEKETVDLMSLVVAAHPDLRGAVEQSHRQNMIAAALDDLSLRNLSRFGVAGGVIAGR